MTRAYPQAPTDLAATGNTAFPEGESEGFPFSPGGSVGCLQAPWPFPLTFLPASHFPGVQASSPPTPPHPCLGPPQPQIAVPARGTWQSAHLPRETGTLPSSSWPRPPFAPSPPCASFPGGGTEVLPTHTLFLYHHSLPPLPLPPTFTYFLLFLHLGPALREAGPSGPRPPARGASALGREGRATWGERRSHPPGARPLPTPPPPPASARGKPESAARGGRPQLPRSTLRGRCSPLAAQTLEKQVCAKWRGGPACGQLRPRSHCLPALAGSAGPSPAGRRRGARAGGRCAGSPLALGRRLSPSSPEPGRVARAAGDCSWGRAGVRGPRRARGNASCPAGTARSPAPSSARGWRALSDSVPAGPSPQPPWRAGGKREARRGPGCQQGGGAVGAAGRERAEPPAPRGARAGQVRGGGGGSAWRARRRCPSPCPRGPALSRATRLGLRAASLPPSSRSRPLSPSPSPPLLSVSLALCLAPLGLFLSPAASLWPSRACFLARLGSVPLSVSRSPLGAGGGAENRGGDSGP